MQRATPRAELLCPVLVGREAERATLIAALDRAFEGGTVALFIAGEAGVGKSRLCHTLIEDALERGLNPVVGYAAAHDSALPYGPIVAALERAFRRFPPEYPQQSARLQPYRQVLGTLLPGLRIVEDESGSEPQGNAAFQRRRIFDALRGSLFAIAATSDPRHSVGGAGPEVGRADIHVSGEALPPAEAEPPLVLVLEDLHWADETSIDLIQDLVLSHARGDHGRSGGALAGPGLLLIGTYRSDAVPAGDMAAGHEVLGRAVASLVSQRVAREMRLAPLTAAEHVSLLAQTLGRPVSVPMANALYVRSDGNPFVTEELLGAMAASGQLQYDAAGIRPKVEATFNLPLSLRAAVLARLEGLSTEARRVLTIAAVIGREFEFDVLQRVSGVDEQGLLDILRAGVNRQVLVEDADHAAPGAYVADDQERFRFRHALTRDTIEGELLGRERRMLHRRVAETLEALTERQAREGASAANLAHHFTQGGDPARAYPYAVAAAEHALQVGALSEAAEHLDRAVEALQEGDPARVALLELQGRVRVALLEVPRAAELLWKARSEATAGGLRWNAAAIGSELAFLTWFADPAASDREWTALLEEAEARTLSAEAEDETALRLYAAAAMCCGSNDAHQAALSWADRAITLASALGASTEPLLFRAFVGRGMARVDSGSFDAGISDLRHAIALGMRYGDPHLALAYNVLIMALTEFGRDQDAIGVFIESREFEERTGAVVAPPPVLYAYLANGRWDEGMEVATAQVDGYGSFGIPTTPQGLAMTGLGHFLLRRGKVSEALAQFESGWERLHAVRDFAWAANSLWGQALAHEARGEREQAATLFARCLEWWERTEDRGTAVPILLDAVRLALAAGGQVEAARWRDQLERLAAGGNEVAGAAVRQASGLLALARGAQEEATTDLGAAIAGWERMGRPYDAARAIRSLGEAGLLGQRNQGGRAEAERLLQDAEQRFAALGAVLEQGETVEIRRRAGLLGQARRRATMDAARAQAAGLTRREVEVLQCLVEGKTNKDLAATLFIAEGTAELHVSRILGKLNCATRTQAATLAVQLGLASPRSAEL